MEGFADSLPQSSLKARLLEALSRNKPFFRFKDVVHPDRVLRDQWFAFRDDAHARYACDWLQAEGLNAELDRPAGQQVEPPTIGLTKRCAVLSIAP